MASRSGGASALSDVFMVSVYLQEETVHQQTQCRACKNKDEEPRCFAGAALQLASSR